jgi:hypothetical protein
MKQQKIPACCSGRTQKANKYFNEAEKHAIIHEFLATKGPKTEFWERYTGEDEEHVQQLQLMKQLGYNFEIKTIRPNSVTEIQTTVKQNINK